MIGLLIRRSLRSAIRFLPVLAAAVIAAIAVGFAGASDGWLTLVDVLLMIGVAVIVLIHPIVMRVVSVPVMAAIRIPGFENPGAAPRRRRSISLLSTLVPLTVVTVLALSNVEGPIVALVAVFEFNVLGGEPNGMSMWEWICLALVVLGGVAEVLIALKAWRVVRRVRASVPQLKAALNDSGVRFAIYTTRGARHRSAYQLQAWLTELQRGGHRGVVIVRDATAVDEFAAVTNWPVVFCPRTADLEIVTAESIRAVFYLNQVARNTDMVAWRGPRHIYLGHGDSNKVLSSHPAHAMYDEIWVAGQHSIDRYADAGVVIEPSKFVVIGRPQLAVFGPDERPAGDERSAATNSSSTVRTALYAPTWHGYNSLTRLSSLPRGTRVVDALVAAGLQVVFRPHPMSRLTREGRTQIAAIQTRLRAETARRAATTSGSAHRSTTFVEAAADADLLVADPSSVIVDFLATARPVIVIRPEARTAGESVDTDPSDAAVLGMDGRVLPAVYQVDASLRELPDVVADALGPDPLRVARLAARDELFGDAPTVGWTKQWDEQLARVLG